MNMKYEEHLIESIKTAFQIMDSRAFGETYIQPLLYAITGDVKYNTTDCDALRNGTLKGEYKAMRLWTKKENKTSTNMFEEILNKSEISSGNVFTNFSSIKEDNKTVNCQNIKLDEFDYLDYLIVCADGLYLFEITQQDFTKYISLPEDDKDHFPNWCDKHGKKESGKNGQFPINKSNVDWHLEHNFKQKITWEQAMSIWEQIKR